MHWDLVQIDSTCKLVHLGEKFTDMDDYILVVKNGVSNKIFDTDSKLNVLQDDVAEIKMMFFGLNHLVFCASSGK